MAEEITYIPYGLDEISLLDLMTSLANGVESYLGSKRWAKKDKYRLAWLNAYLNIINRGITGASNDSGIWKINHKGENFTLDTMSNTEREMYQDAAYYIRNQMSQLPTRKSLEKEKNEEKDEKETSKTTYDNKLFLGGLTSYVGNLDYGGEESKKWINDWIKLDLETNGIYGREKRQAKLAEYLKGYRDKLELELNKWDFSKGPYGSYDEFNNRINKAIEALNNSEWNLDDIDALNKLGLDREAWLSNGENNLVSVTDKNGNTLNITRAEYNALLAEQTRIAEEAKAKEEAEKKKRELELLKLKINLIKLNITKYKSLSFSLGNNPFGILEFSNIPTISSESDIIPYLRNLLLNIKDTKTFKDKINLIQGGYLYANNKGLLKPISDESWEALFKFKGSKEKYNEGNRKWLKQLEGFNNIIFNTYNNRIIFLGEDEYKDESKDAIKKMKKRIKESHKFYPITGVASFRKLGGTINNLDTIIEDFFKNNNI